MNTTDTNEDGYDAVNAFEQRRQMYLNLQEVQRLEHEVFKRISDVAVSRKKELLEILSIWLLSQSQYSPDHLEVESMTGCDIQSWISLQNEAAHLQLEADQTERAAQAADEKYKTAAPMGYVGMGFVNEWVADDAKKATIQNLAVNARLTASTRDEAAKRLASNVKTRQDFGRRFFRACLANIQDLEYSSVFGTRARTIIGEITRTIETEWLSHQQATYSVINLLDNNLTQLRRIYRIKEK